MVLDLSEVIEAFLTILFGVQHISFLATKSLMNLHDILPLPTARFSDKLVLFYLNNSIRQLV